jgi:hypothetical protein
MKLRALCLFLTICITAPGYSSAFMQDSTTTGTLIGAPRAITTAVPFLSITPDARHAALGDAGVASSPDANSAYWNAAKLVYIDKKYGVGGSYTPWLGKIVNDMWIAHISGFYKLSQEQAVAFSFKYFNLGEISFRGPNNEPLGDFNPKEMALDATYSRKLTENFSVGLTGRYIYSNLTGAFSGSDAQAGNGVAADVGLFYTKPSASKNSLLSFGLQISNIGAKISYTDNANKDFMPTNIRLGTSYRKELDPYNSLTFLLDFNKLMVPTVRDPTTPLLKGMFGSFGDASGKEEIHEIMTSLGIEYWYHDIFALRMGYFLEAKDKGDRKYLTAGFGFRKEKFGIDVAYVVPTNQREHPLAETLRFSLHFLMPESQLEKRQSITN